MADDQDPTGDGQQPAPIEQELQPQVVRLNRRAIFVAGALATAVILAAVFTLSERSRRAAERREQSAGVSAAPDRFWEGEPDGVPRLPAPVSAAPSPAPSEIPELESSPHPQLIELADEAADQTLRRAFTSRPVVFEGRVDRSTDPSRPAARQPAAAPPVDAASVLQAAKGLYPTGLGEEDPTVAQNLQRENALAAIEWPDDELRVYATLRGPLFAIGDDALLAYRHRVGGHLHTLRPHEPAQLDSMDASERAVAEALELLAMFHRRRNHRPIAETIALLLASVRAHAGIAIWPTGEQALANCLRTIDVARRFESRGAASFRAFVEYLDDQAEHGEAQDAPVVEEGTEGVRIMTVHKAKGLEFPVVVLADPTCNLVGRNPTRHVDPARGVWAESLCGCVPHDLRDAEALELRHDREESIRLSYVAATRARDLLIVPTIGDLEARPGERWLEMLEPVLYPSFEKRRESELAPGCPEFGEDSVLERPESCSRGTTASVRPGLVQSEAGDQPVVWWDPSVLKLDVEEEVGLRQQRILQADEAGEHSEAGVRAHAAWQARRGEMLAQGATESVRLARVVDLAVERRGDAEDIAVEEVEFDRSGRPGGRRFGSLVHAVLAAVDLEAGEASIQATARTHGRIVGATEEEIEAAAQAAQAALTHPLMRRAAAAGQRGDLRRETPVFLCLEDGRLVEGFVDLAFREKTGNGTVWTVVDFKTDTELSVRRAQYEAQVALYAEAIATATGETAAGVLLMV